MRYFIYLNQQIEEVPEEYYSEWIENNKPNFSIQEYCRSNDTTFYSIETMYQGALDKDEWDNPMPFILFYFENTLELSIEGVDVNTGNNFIDYFKTFEELSARRVELIKEIEKKVF